MQTSGLPTRQSFVVEMVTGLVAPLMELVQFAGDRLKVSCKTKPAVFGDQEMVGAKLTGRPGRRALQRQHFLYRHR